jgi:hypothetical protein
LLDAAIDHVVKPWPVRPPQSMARIHSGDLTVDAQTAAFDAVFAELIGPGEEELTHLEPDQLQPLIDSIETLVGSAGRAQAEAACAAIAALRAAGAPVQTRLRAILRAVDEELREIARESIRVGRRLENLVGEPMDDAAPSLHDAEAALRRWSDRLLLVRESCFGAVGRVALTATGGA